MRQFKSGDIKDDKEKDGFSASPPHL